MSLGRGYGYECKAQDWKHSADDDWEIVEVSSGGGTFLGFRIIDNARCTVWRKGKRVFAQTAVYAKPPKGLQ